MMGKKAGSEISDKKFAMMWISKQRKFRCYVYPKISDAECKESLITMCNMHHCHYLYEFITNDLVLFKYEP